MVKNFALVSGRAAEPVSRCGQPGARGGSLKAVLPSSGYAACTAPFSTPYELSKASRHRRSGTTHSFRTATGRGRSSRARSSTRPRRTGDSRRPSPTPGRSWRSTRPRVDEGTKAALTSLTYNAGETWVNERPRRGRAARRSRRGALDLRAIQQGRRRGSARTREPQGGRGALDRQPGARRRQCDGSDRRGLGQHRGAASEIRRGADARRRCSSRLAGWHRARPMGGPRSVLRPLRPRRRTATAATDEPAPVFTSRSFSDLSRLVQLDNGHELMTAHAAISARIATGRARREGPFSAPNLRAAPGLAGDSISA